MQGGLDGRPGVPDSCRWVVRVVVEVFDEFLDVVTLSSSGLKDEWDKVDTVVPVELLSSLRVWPCSLGDRWRRI